MAEKETAIIHDFDGRQLLLAVKKNAAAAFDKYRKLIDFISGDKAFQEEMEVSIFQHKIRLVNMDIAKGVRCGEETARKALDAAVKKVLRMMCCSENQIKAMVAAQELIEAIAPIPAPYRPFEIPAPWWRKPID